MIARDWNTTDERSGFAGFVTRFQVDDTYLSRFPVQTAGGRGVEELWVPAEELQQFNQNIQGQIQIVEAYAGARFAGTLDPISNLPTG